MQGSIQLRPMSKKLNSLCPFETVDETETALVSLISA